MHSLTKSLLAVYPRFEVVGVTLWKAYPVMVDRDLFALEVSALDETVTDLVESVLPNRRLPFLKVSAHHNGVLLVTQHHIRHVLYQVVQLSVEFIETRVSAGQLLVVLAVVSSEQRGIQFGGGATSLNDLFDFAKRIDSQILTQQLFTGHHLSHSIAKIVQDLIDSGSKVFDKNIGIAIQLEFSTSSQFLIDVATEVVYGV